MSARIQTPSTLASRALACLQVLALVANLSPASAYAKADETKTDTSSGSGSTVINNTTLKVTQGDTAAKVPNVDEICTALRYAASGNFVDENGSDLKTVDSACAANYTYAIDQVKNCSMPFKDVIKNAKTETGAADLESLCAGANGKLSSKIETYCTLRNISQTSQAMQYCAAYESTAKAEKSLNITMTLDIAAAGICWAEYLSVMAIVNARKAAGTASSPNLMGAGSIMNTGACGGATMAAAMGEMVQTANVLIGGNHTTGEFKIDSSNNVKEKKDFNFEKVVEVVGSAGLSAKALQIGVCYYGSKQFSKLCGGLNGYDKFSKGSMKVTDLNKNKALAQNAAADTAAYDKSIQDYKDLQPGYENGAVTDERLAQAGQNIDAKADAAMRSGNAKLELDKTRDAFEARANLAKQSGIIFTGLGAMRLAAKVAAVSTRKKARETLQSMFDPSNNTTTMGSGGTLTNNLPNLFASTAGTYTSGFYSAASTQSAATAADSPESFLAPKGSKLETAASNLAKQNASSMKDVESGSGFGNAVAGAAMSAGAKDSSGLNALRSQASSIFANLPTDGGGYKSGGGGGRSLASKDAGGDLNLKSLFGGGDEEKKDGKEDLAFRGPAEAEDIWHSKNPKGNNLFQIVSDKYDTVQRHTTIGSEP